MKQELNFDWTSEVTSTRWRLHVQYFKKNLFLLLLEKLLVYHAIITKYIYRNAWLQRVAMSFIQSR